MFQYRHIHIYRLLSHSDMIELSLLENVNGQTDIDPIAEFTTYFILLIPSILQVKIQYCTQNDLIIYIPPKNVKQFVN